jgi:hypothetical protein
MLCAKQARVLGNMWREAPMKIGILTFHRPINYGAYLQAFSLSNQLTINNRNHSVEIIDYIAPLEKQKIIINVLWGIKHYGILNGFRDMQKIRAFHSAYKELPLSSRKRFRNLAELYRYIDESYDVVIIGSDAVFNWKQNGYPTAFIPDCHFKHCKLISYAASVHGMRYLEEAEKLPACGKTFANMPLVGVRDHNTENFVRTCYKDAQIIHCCDPTVMIDTKKIQSLAGEYKKRILKKYQCDLSQKYIVLMMPDCLFTARVRERFSKDYQIITLFKPSKDADHYLYDLNPFEWAMVLSGAAAVVTSYFHGALLSFRQNTPALVADFSDYNDGNYESKLKDLLFARLELPECYFEGQYLHTEEYSEKMLRSLEVALAGAYNRRIASAMQQEAVAFEVFYQWFQEIVEG